MEVLGIMRYSSTNYCRCVIKSLQPPFHKLLKPGQIRILRYCLTLLLSLAMSTLVQARAISPFSVTASASPASIQAGETEKLTATVKTINDHTNWSVAFTVAFNGTALASENYTGLRFGAGVPLTKSWSWQVPADAAPGTYAFTAQIFDETGSLLST